jgi:hypothetical protein
MALQSSLNMQSLSARELSITRSLKPIVVEESGPKKLNAYLFFEISLISLNMSLGFKNRDCGRVVF